MANKKVQTRIVKELQDGSANEIAVIKTAAEFYAVTK